MRKAGSIHRRHASERRGPTALPPCCDECDRIAFGRPRRIQLEIVSHEIVNGFEVVSSFTDPSISSHQFPSFEFDQRTVDADKVDVEGTEQTQKACHPRSRLDYVVDDKVVSRRG